MTFLYKWFLISLLFFFAMSVAYNVGVYRSRRFDKMQECSIKLQQEVMSGRSPYIEELHNASFDVVHMYVLGRTYHCAFLENNDE